MIKAYKDFWARYFDFGGKTSVGGFWWVVLVNFIIGIIVGFVGGLLKLEIVMGLYKYNIITTIWSLLIFIPELSILVRRLRDGGNHWANIFWAFLPIIGWIILIIKLCK